MAQKRTLFYIAIAHYVCAVTAGVSSFSLGMSRFDSLQPESLWEKIFDGVASVLLFPAVPYYRLLPVPKSTFSGLIGHLLIFANSLLWACLIYTIVMIWWKRKRAAVDRTIT